MTSLLQSIAERSARIEAHFKGVGDKLSLPALRNYSYPLKDRLGYSDVNATVTAIDTGKATASATITTMEQDRDGDIVIPKGCIETLKHYAKNPRVFFSHQEWPLPVGSARTPEGEIAVKVLDDRVESTCHFHLRTLESEQVYDLVANHEIETTSIGFMPIKGERLNQADRPGRNGEGKDIQWPGWRFDTWELLEWSWVGVPSNAEAIAHRLGKGRLAGKPIAAGLRKCLECYAVPRKAWTNGIGESTMSKKWKKAKPVVKQEPPVAAAKTDDCVSEKIRILLDEGKTQEEAAAIAYQQCGQTGEGKADNASSDMQAIAIPKTLAATAEEAAALVEQQGKSTENVQETPEAFVFVQFSEAECRPDSLRPEQMEGGVTVMVCERQVTPDQPVVQEAGKSACSCKEKTVTVAKMDGSAALEAEAEQIPLGAACLRELIEHVQSKAPMIEQPEVKDFYDALLEEALDLAAGVYPEVEFGTEEEPPEETPIETPAATGQEVPLEMTLAARRARLKAGRFLNRKRSADITDVADDLEEIAADETVKRAYRKTLVHDGGILRAMVKESTGEGEQAGDDEDAQMKSIEILSARFDDMFKRADKIQECMPA